MCLRHSFFKGYRNMSPYLEGKDDRRGEQKGADRDMSNRGHYHRELGLYCIATPRHASEKCGKAKA